MNKHTPGPWSVGHMRPVKYAAGITQYETPVHVGEGGSRGNCLAIVYLGGPGATTSTPEVTAANARLIAHAPELLAALRITLRACRSFQDYDRTLADRQYEQMAAIAQAEALLNEIDGGH